MRLGYTDRRLRTLELHRRALAGPCLMVVGLLAGLLSARAQPGPPDPAAATAAQSAAPSPATAGTPTQGLRFASLKSDRVNLRSGPGTEYPTSWVYRRAGLPLEIIKDFEGWRQVRDAEGATGWVLQHFLSGRRTALVMPWDVKPNTPVPLVELYDDDSARAGIVAKIEAGVIANIISCDGMWCWVSIEPYKGYIPQKKLWGVYAGEVVK